MSFVEAFRNKKPGHEFMDTDGRYDYVNRGFCNGQVIKMGTAKQTSFQDVMTFHGHIYPGTVIGYRAAKIATLELSSDKSLAK